MGVEDKHNTTQWWSLGLSNYAWSTSTPSLGPLWQFLGRKTPRSTLTSAAP